MTLKDLEILLLGLYQIVENVNSNSFLYTNVHDNIILNSKNVETTSLSISRSMDKQNVLYTYTMQYYSVIKINEFPIYTMT